METMSVMSKIQDMEFKAVGPFLVADLTKQQAQFQHLPTGQHGMESVEFGQITEPHTHDFASFYKAEGLNVVCGKTKYTLPQYSLTLVLPGVRHSWENQGTNAGAIGSIDNRHEKQVIL